MTQFDVSGKAGDDASSVVEDGSIAGIPYRWVAMMIVVFGGFMVALDVTVVNLGLPALQRDFDTVDGIEWVVTAYLAAVGVVQMVSGWLADRFGRKTTIIWSMIMFTSGSIACAAAPNLEALVAARILQGFGGGLLFPVSMVMIYELFEPNERGTALGYLGVAVMAAPALGPVLGGALVSSVGWRWLFLINVPIGLIGIPLAFKLLKETGFRESRRLDHWGVVLGSVALSALLVGFSMVQLSGWSNRTVLILILGGALLLVAFTRRTLRVVPPLIELRILANPVFAIGLTVFSLMSVLQFTRLVYIPLELSTVRSIPEVRIGLAMLPSALGVALTMPLSGRLADRIGARLPATIGTTLACISFIGLANLTGTTSLPKVALCLFIGGLGAGLTMPAANIVSLNSIESRKISQSSALHQTFRQLAAAIGLSIIASIFATIRIDGDPAAMPPAEALSPYRTIFFVGAGIAAFTVVVAQFLPGKAKSRQLQAARKIEFDAQAGSNGSGEVSAISEF